MPILFIFQNLHTVSPKTKFCPWIFWRLGVLNKIPNMFDDEIDMMYSYLCHSSEKGMCNWLISHEILCVLGQEIHTLPTLINHLSVISKHSVSLHVQSWNWLLPLRSARFMTPRITPACHSTPSMVSRTGGLVHRKNKHSVNTGSHQSICEVFSNHSSSQVKQTPLKRASSAW